MNNIEKINNLPKKYNYIINLDRYELNLKCNWFNLIDAGFHNLLITFFSKKIKVIETLKPLHNVVPKRRFIVKNNLGYISTMDYNQLKEMINTFLENL